MTNIAILNGSFVITWSQLLCALGILAGFCISMAAVKLTRCSRAAVIAWTILTIVLSYVFGRAVHWYCHSEQYGSLWKALTGLSSGGFVITGLLLGALISALLVKLLHLTDTVNRLLDTTAPGLLVALAFLRLSCLFTDTCHSKVTVTAGWAQHLPFSIAETDAAGNQTHSFATFFVSFLVLMIAAVLILILQARYKSDYPGKIGKHQHPGRNVSGAFASGDVARISLTVSAAAEIVLDSTRNDASQLHFRLLDFLNRYVSFVSFAMLTGAVALLCLLIHYLKVSKKRSGRWTFGCTGCLVLFVIGIGLVGAFEYLVQRYTNMATPYHLIQAAGCILMGLSILLQIHMMQTK